MARELQSDLFADRKLPNEPQTQPVQRLSWSADEEDWRSVLIHIDQLRKRVSELESSQTQTQNRQTELVQATKVRIERMMGACQRMDELIKNFTAEISEKMNAMTLRLNERKLADHKIQELVDRHASMVQSYEIRLASLQKILSEQEMLLMNARSALQDVQRRR